jgi:hypothetical protein
LNNWILFAYPHETRLNQSAYSFINSDVGKARQSKAKQGKAGKAEFGMGVDG